MGWMVRNTVLVLTIGLTAGLSARADVSGYSASASSSIVQYQGGVEKQRDDQAQSYPGVGSVMPLEVSHKLTGSNSSGRTTWSAFNRVTTNDPQYNADIPTDFITEAAVGSTLSDVVLKVTSQSAQTRRVNLQASEFPGRAAGTTLNLKSIFTLDGALAAIVPNTATNANGLQVKCNLKVKKDADSVWDGTVLMTGKSDGTFDITTSGNFHDNDFVVATNEVPDLAKIWIVAFGDAELPYTYQGQVGDSFDLSAELNFEYLVPGGLGAGSAFGTVPSQMIDMTRELFGPQASSFGLNGLVPTAAPEPATGLIFLTGWVVSGLRRRK
jgi:hypothetical protein